MPRHQKRHQFDIKREVVFVTATHDVVTQKKAFENACTEGFLRRRLT
jgi:hypothetical protein